MSDTQNSVVCTKCQTRFRVKPNIYKFMKMLRCTKCGNQIPLVAPSKDDETEAAVPAAPIDTEIASNVVPAVKPPKPEAPTPLAETESEEPAPPPAAPKNIPERQRDTKPEPAPETNPVSRAEDLETINALEQRLKHMEKELAESDARIASLQEMWHSKEVEAREMSERLTRAEKTAAEAVAIRDTFLAKIKNELAMHLLKERDASLNRFAELESKLLAQAPEPPTPHSK